MATPVNKLETVVGVAKEVTEGTYVAPTDFLLSLPGIANNPAREELVRENLRADIGEVAPRIGIKTIETGVPLELKAGGTEGADPEMDLFLESALGNKRTISVRVTTKAGNGTTQLEIEDADIASLSVGDFIIVLESGDHTMHFITVKDSGAGTANVTITPARSAPADNVQISKSVTYFPANSGHSSLSVTTFWGDTIDERAIGCKVASFSLDNFTTGQLASIAFSMAGLNFARVDGGSSSPVFSSALPPVLLNACIFQDGIQLELNDVTLSFTNEIAQQRDLCSTQGIVSQRVKKRSIAGTINPYLDDTVVDQFNKFDLNTQYTLMITAASPSAVAGELDLGSAIGIFLPQVISTADPVGDVDDLLTDAIEFKATQGSSGDQDDIFIGFV